MHQSIVHPEVSQNQKAYSIKKRWTAKRVAALSEMKEAGATADQIADRLGIPVEAVNARIQEDDIKRNHYGEVRAFIDSVLLDKPSNTKWFEIIDGLAEYAVKASPIWFEEKLDSYLISFDALLELSAFTEEMIYRRCRDRHIDFLRKHRDRKLPEKLPPLRKCLTEKEKVSVLAYLAEHYPRYAKCLEMYLGGMFEDDIEEALGFTNNAAFRKFKERLTKYARVALSQNAEVR